MVKHIMRRSASDNPYLHRDFHGALSAGIEFVHEHYGEDAVREYLWQFARSFYAPVTKALENRGLVALEEHFRTIYEIEADRGKDVDAVIHLARSEHELRIKVDACPAVAHMRAQGYPVARLFRETTDTVNRAICDTTPFAAELLDYDEETGRSVQRFYRRELEQEKS